MGWKTLGEGWECRPDGHWVHTGRLLLRPLTAKDVDALPAVFDEEVVRWQGYCREPVALREMAYRWAQAAGRPQPQGQLRYDWAICDRGSGELVGARSMVVYRSKRHGLAYDTGSNLKAGWRDKGYGAEELRAVLQLSQVHLGYGTAYAGTDPANHRAIHVYEKCGFRVYGKRPGWVLPNGTNVEAVVMRHRQPAHRSCRTALREPWLRVLGFRARDR